MLPVKIALMVLAVVTCCTAAAAQGNIITTIVDYLGCRRTRNYGFAGQCVRRSCCRSSASVNGLCLNSQYTCCYGEDVCEEERFHALQGSRRPGYPPNRRPGDRYPTRDYCQRDIISRYDWDAEPGDQRPLRLPSHLKHVIVHHSGDEHDACWSFEDCRYKIRQLQRYHQLEKGFPDIPWNFIITDNGEIFEGVGWNDQGYHTERWNDRSLGVAFLGDFDMNNPSPRAMDAFHALLDCGIESRYLDPYFQVYGHRDMRPTNCPGDSLYQAIRYMKNYNSNKLGFIDLLNSSQVNANLTKPNLQKHSSNTDK